MIKQEIDMKKCIGEEAELAIDLLDAEGYEAFLVGGCVRDFIMGKVPEDVDITTNALPEETKAVFTSRGYKVIETGMKHGTVTVLICSVPLEITTYRVDGTYSDHRRPDTVAFTTNIEEDLARRDFTINALAWSPSRGFVDIYGGRADLEAGVLRCVGDPVARFREDALRILRALRFAARLGFEIEERTAAALLSEKELLRQVSVERIFSEFKKLISGKHATNILLNYVEVLGIVIPEILPMKGFQQNNPHHIHDVWTHSVLVLDSLSKICSEGKANPDKNGMESNGAPGVCYSGDEIPLRLAALFHDIGKPGSYSADSKGVGHFYGHGKKSVDMTRHILTRLKADAFTRERVLTLVQYHDTGIAEEKRSIKRWLSRLGPELFFELLTLKRADNMAQNRAVFDRQPQYQRIQEMTVELLSAGECFSMRNLVVGGEDLIREGMHQGPEIGRILRLLLAAVMNGEVENQREALLVFANQNRI